MVGLSEKSRCGAPRLVQLPSCQTQSRPRVCDQVGRNGGGRKKTMARPIMTQVGFHAGNQRSESRYSRGGVQGGQLRGVRNGLGGRVVRTPSAREPNFGRWRAMKRRKRHRMQDGVADPVCSQGRENSTDEPI